MPHEICDAVVFLDRNENNVGSSSPGCISRIDQSIVRPSSRGGVPVLSRPNGRPNPSSRSAILTDGFSPMRPPGCATSPIWITPRKNVPVVKMTVIARTSDPSARIIPTARSPSIIKSTASPMTTSRLLAALISFCIA